jgi:hypothetical protein
MQQGHGAAYVQILTQRLFISIPQFAAKLKRSVKQHPLREMHIEQVRNCPAVWSTARAT